jgi:hypothetical protein
MQTIDNVTNTENRLNPRMMKLNLSGSRTALIEDCANREKMPHGQKRGEALLGLRAPLRYNEEKRLPRRE